MCNLAARILLGLEERRLQPVAVDFERHSHLLILGDNECGKTSTLRTLCREIVRTKTAAEAQLLIVDFRRSLLGVVESEHLGGYAMSPAALGGLLPGLLEVLQRRMPPSDASQTQLRARSWWSGPDIYVADRRLRPGRHPGRQPAHSRLSNICRMQGIWGCTWSWLGAAGAPSAPMFEPLLAGLRDLGCMTLMMSGRPDEGALWGSSRPARLPPGRGVLITRAGDEQVVQVAWSPPP